MKSSQGSYLKGQFIISMPELKDPNFYQTVTCICEHTLEGAMGIVINRPHPTLKAADLFQELVMDYIPLANNIPVHVGGPVHLGEVFILHGPPLDWQGSLNVTTSLALSNSRDILEAIALDKGPKYFIISLGCAGWGPDQLEFELRENAWLTTAASHRILFDTPSDKIWDEAVKLLGIDPILLSGTAGHA